MDGNDCTQNPTIAIKLGTDIAKAYKVIHLKRKEDIFILTVESISTLLRI